MAKREFRAGGGLNLRPGSDVIADDELIQSVGCRFDEFGVVTSEPGNNLLATVTGGSDTGASRADSVFGFAEYKLNDIWYLACQGTHAWQQLLYESPYTEVSLTALSPSFRPMTGIMFNGVAYLTNGFTLRRVIRTVASGVVTAGGTGYTVGDKLTLSGGSFSSGKTDANTGAVFNVDTITGGGGTGPVGTISLDDGGKYTTEGTAGAHATTGGTGSSCTITPTYGVALERVGVSAPSTALTLSNETAGGASVNGATYKWVYTFFNGIAESNFSPEAEHTFSAGSKNLDVTGIAAASGNDAATISRRLYRTDQAGSSFFFITEIADNTTNAFTDSLGLVDADSEATTGDEITNEQRKADKRRLNSAIKEAKRAAKKAHEKFDMSAFLETYYSDMRASRGEIIQTNLGILAEWSDHNIPLSGAAGGIRTLRLLGDFVFGINFNNTLVFSHLLNPEHWSAYDRVRIGRDTGDELVTIEPIDADMMCFTNLGVYRFRRLGADATNSTLEQVNSPTGCRAEMGVAATEKYGLIFIGEDGLYRYDGRDVTLISQGIDDIFSDSSHADYAHPDARNLTCMVSRGDKVWISYYAGSSYTEGTHFPNRTLMLDFQEGKPKWSNSSVGFTSLFKGHDNRLFGGNESNEVYELDKSDGSTSITWTTQSKYFPISTQFGGDTPDTIWVDADFGNISTTITLLGDEGETIMTWTVTGSNGRTKHRKLVPLGKIYDRMSIRITSAGNATRKLFGWGFSTDDARVE